MVNICLLGNIWSHKKPDSDKGFVHDKEKKDGEVKGIDLASDRPRNGIYHLLAVSYRASYRTSLSLSCLVYSSGIRMPPLQGGCDN